MANTTNYNWETPDDTDLVKDGAAAIRSLGSAIDTTVFTNAGAAVAKSLIDAEGDLIVGDAADAVQRLAIGSNGNVLTVDTAVDGKIKWAAPATGAMTQIADTTLGAAAADITFSSIPSTYNHLMVIISGRTTAAGDGTSLSVQLNSDTGSNYIGARNTTYAGSGSNVTVTSVSAQTALLLGNIWAAKSNVNYNAAVQMTFPNYKLTTMQKTMIFSGGALTDAPAVGTGVLQWQNTAAITTIKIFSTANFDTGTRATLYGLV